MLLDEVIFKQNVKCEGVRCRYFGRKVFQGDNKNWQDPDLLSRCSLKSIENMHVAIFFYKYQRPFPAPRPHVLCSQIKDTHSLYIMICHKQLNSWATSNIHFLTSFQ